jgi:hypothetical protein
LVFFIAQPQATRVVNIKPPYNQYSTGMELERTLYQYGV